MQATTVTTARERFLEDFMAEPPVLFIRNTIQNLKSFKLALIFEKNKLFRILLTNALVSGQFGRGPALMQDPP